MSLQDINDRIEANRAEAARTSQFYRQEITSVQGDRQYSDEGKRQRVENIRAEWQARVADLHEREKQIVADSIRDLQRRVYGTAGSTPDAVISFRDAQERAEKLEGSSQALPVMERALINEDTGMAQALLSCAFDRGWGEVIDAYSEKYPAKTQDLIGLSRLNAMRNDVGYKIMSSMHYSAS